MTCRQELERRIRMHAPCAAACGARSGVAVNFNELSWFGHWERRQQHLADDREQGCMDADAERERHNSRRREYRRANVGSQRESSVSPCIIKPSTDPDVADLLLDLLNTAEFNPGLTACVCRRPSGRDVMLRALIDVEPQLLLDIGAPVSTAEDSFQDRHGFTPRFAAPAK